MLYQTAHPANPSVSQLLSHHWGKQNTTESNEALVYCLAALNHLLRAKKKKNTKHSYGDWEMHYASFPLPKRDLDVEGFLSTASPGLEFPAATSAGARRLLCVYSVPSSPIKASFIICYEKEALCFGLRCFSFLFLSFIFF